ncbi:MAG: Crp/Fnr family transcriptional regulator [Pseudomonadota bacterium]
MAKTKNAQANGGLEKALLSASVPFAGIEGPVRGEILRLASHRRLKAGDTLFRQADDARAFFLLLDGFVRLLRTTRQGEQVVLHHVTAGNLFGIAKATESKSYSVTARAASDCLVLSWTSDLWDRIAELNPAFGAAARRTLGARMQEMTSKVVEMATRSVEQRIALALLRLTDKAGVATDVGTEVAFPITRQDISELTGANTHSVSRVMSAWQRSGIIQSHRRKVIVARPDLLADISMAA